MISIDRHLASEYSDLNIVALAVENVEVERASPALETLKEQVAGEIEVTYDLEALKNDQTIRRYRDFFWRLGIDPTKIRPASEALIRRILQGKPIPRINTLVDSYNLVSIETEIALAAFDADRLRGDLKMRFARQGEEFLGVGMDRPVVLKGNEIVVADEERLVAIYPYRDAEFSKIKESTTNALLMVCGVPGISEESLKHASATAIDCVIKFCGGTVR